MATNVYVEVKSVNVRNLSRKDIKQEELKQLEIAIKKFRNKIKKTDLINKIFEGMYYEKPSSKKRKIKNKQRLKSKYAAQQL